MKTVLVADDDVITRKLLKKTCQELGYHVLESKDGDDALRILKKKKVDFLISDWIMPGMDGITLCESIRKDPEGKAPFFFLMTARKKGLQNYNEALQAGVDDFVYKPVDFYVLRNQLKEAERRCAC